jgi:excisionase family DNA binding protein
MAPPLIHSIAEACSTSKTGRTALYEAIRSGSLRAVKRGRRTLILDDDLRRWVQSFPTITATASETQFRKAPNVRRT